MSFPAYGSYKDSGVEWLGAVPSHWEVKRLKQVANAFPSNVDKKSYDDQEQVRLCNYTDVYYNDTISTDLEFMEATASADQVEKFGLRADDVIITKDSETADDIAIAAHVPRDLPGVVCGYHLSMVRPGPGASGAFLKRFFDSAFAKASFAVRANGLTRLGLGQYAVDNVDVPHPPLGEQRAIAAFLDRETAKIDALVEAQRRLIELLKEKRQVVISLAVTKGLDPSAPMKNSGVERLAHVPAHWEVVSIKHAIELATSGPRGWSDMLGDEGSAFFQSQNIGRAMEVLLQDAARINPPDDADAERARVRTDDVVVCITGARTGAVAHVQFLPVEAFINQHVCLLRPQRARAEGRYLAYCLFSSAGQEQLSLAMYGLKQGLGLEQVRSQRVALPPLDEQRRIVERLDAGLAEFNGLIANAEAAIALLQERRAALVSAAVTGKINVQAQEPVVVAGRDQVRLLVAAAIVDRLAHRQNFGRVKLQKLIYLAEAHVGVDELDGSYVRAAAGPLDRAMIEQMEVSLEQSGHFAVSQVDGRGGQVSYHVLGERGAFREKARSVLKEREAKLTELVEVFADLDTKSTEAVATLYAAWNDLLRDGAVASDDAIVSEVLTNWHPEKAKKFKAAELGAWLQWMRRRGLTPRGAGPRTTTGRLFI